MRRTLFAIPLLFLLIFYFYPLVKITAYSLLQDGSLAPQRLLAGLGSIACKKTVFFTLWQAALSTLLTLALALPGAWIFQRYNFFGKRFLLAVMSIPFVMPTVVCAAAFEAMLGNHGLINQLAMAMLPLDKPPLSLDHSVAFFLLAHVFYNYSLVLRIVSSYWSGIDSRLSAAARMLGASPWRCFCTITLPLLLPAIAAAALLVFIFSFTSFGIILILGGPAHATLEVEIYRQAVHLFNLPLAATLSLVQIIINMLLMWFHARLGQNHPVSFFAEESIKGVAPQTISAKLAVGTTTIFIALLLIAPMASLFFASISGENGLTLNYYKALATTNANSLFFVPPTAAIYNSLGFATAAMLLALLLGLISAFFLAEDRKGTVAWDTLIMLPLATSAVTLGFGYILTLSTPPLNLRNSLALLPIAHALVALPFVMRITLPAIRQIPQQLRDAAILLGASPTTVLRTVELPLIRNAVLIAAIFAFSISMGEFGATSLLFRPQLPTLPMAIFRFLGTPGTLNYGQAMAMASLLMLVTGAGFFIIGSLEKK
ncbi:MAG: thiamine biosynthesis protein ThiP [Desulfobacterales bacterium]|nr:MAG: thiamine biosynthesis protein ThiP [Desulfobacterales bacterium]